MKESVALLADKPAEELQEELFVAGQIIEAAKQGRIAVIIAKHNETEEEGAILCAVNPSEDRRTASYVPLAVLSTTMNPIWPDYDPPEAATPPSDPGPLEVFEDDEKEDGS